MFGRKKPFKIYFNGEEDCDQVQRIVKYLKQYYGDVIDHVEVPKKYK